MKGYEIVREETGRMARGMAPLALIAFGVLVLAGFDPVRVGVSLLLGRESELLGDELRSKNDKSRITAIRDKWKGGAGK